jgi:hypothetical protein
MPALCTQLARTVRHLRAFFWLSSLDPLALLVCWPTLGCVRYSPHVICW